MVRSQAIDSNAINDSRTVTALPAEAIPETVAQPALRTISVRLVARLAPVIDRDLVPVDGVHPGLRILDEPCRGVRHRSRPKLDAGQDAADSLGGMQSGDVRTVDVLQRYSKRSGVADATEPQFALGQGIGES